MAEEKQEKRLTREDVVRLIEENGGTAQGLDLKGADLWDVHLEGANLQGAYLEGAYLGSAHLEKADLSYAHLEKADLSYAHLEEANLWDVHLERAYLRSAHLEGAYFGGAYLKGAYLFSSRFSNDTKLDGADWGNYIIGEENKDQFDWAEDIYRRLKLWYTNAGMYEIAGQFFFREMTARRKETQWWPNPFPRAWSKFISVICGYGERPLRVIGWAASVILVSTLIYFFIGSIWEWSAFWNSLYFSAVSFTALGYGSWLQVTNDWIRGIGAFESFIGVFSIALFLVTFTRKMTR